jgi:hypothetical protein
MHLQPIAAIFQLIIDTDALARQLAGLAQHQDPAFELVGERRREDETARLDAGDQVRALARDQRGDAIDRFGEAGSVEQQGADVAEVDARLGMIRDGADQRPQVSVERNGGSP